MAPMAPMARVLARWSMVTCERCGHGAGLDLVLQEVFRGEGQLGALQSTSPGLGARWEAGGLPPQMVTLRLLLVAALVAATSAGLVDDAACKVKELAADAKLKDVNFIDNMMDCMLR